MSHQISWSCSVEEFFNRSNWQGQLPLMPQAVATGTNHQSNWQCFSVEEFFNRSNWQGQLPLMPQAVATGTNHQSNWQCLAVQEFFNLCNWQGQPLESSNWHHLAPRSDLKTPVREFFQFIPWEGKPEIGSLPQKSTIPASVAAFAPTLTDLSELF